MVGIFTRKAILSILNADDMTPEERTEQLFSLYGRAIDDGYITKNAAEAAKNEAVQAAQATQPAPPPINVKDSDDYKALAADFEAYKQRETARRSDDFKSVKSKFFETVYDKIDRSDKAKPVAEQLEALKEQYEEYFTAADQPPAKSTNQPPQPQFGTQTQGQLPSGDSSAANEFAKLWNFGGKK